MQEIAELCSSDGWTGCTTGKNNVVSVIHPSGFASFFFCVNNVHSGIVCAVWGAGDVIWPCVNCVPDRKGKSE